MTFHSSKPIEHKHLRERMKKKTILYWLGNAAKTKIVSEILAQLIDGQETLIFDYGCGTGGAWRTILQDYHHIKLIGYEPNIQNYNIAKERLKNLNAEILTGDELYSKTFKAKFIVSFSVFEHVYYRKHYLQTAKKHLDKDGVFYLNYDDGHFRNVIHLHQPHLWAAELKVWAHNLLAKPLAAMGYVSQYQKRVYRSEVDTLIEQTGLQIIRMFYSNLASLKRLHKQISQEKIEEFSQYWLEIEDRLNEEFLTNGSVVLGDTVNLWQVMGSFVH